jgi:hypothetical protein
MLPPTKKLPLIANIGIDLQPQADGQKEWILNLKKMFRNSVEVCSIFI